MRDKHSPKGYDKGKRFSKQAKTIFNYLKSNTATNTMVSKATGIPQKNICRYKRDFELLGILQEVERKLCKITGHRASYLTTNKELFKIK